MSYYLFSGSFSDVISLMAIDEASKSEAERNCDRGRLRISPAWIRREVHNQASDAGRPSIELCILRERHRTLRSWRMVVVHGSKGGLCCVVVSWQRIQKLVAKDDAIKSFMFRSYLPKAVRIWDGISKIDSVNNTLFRSFFWIGKQCCLLG